MQPSSERISPERADEGYRLLSPSQSLHLTEASTALKTGQADLRASCAATISLKRREQRDGSSTVGVGKLGYLETYIRGESPVGLETESRAKGEPVWRCPEKTLERGLLV